VVKGKRRRLAVTATAVALATAGMVAALATMARADGPIAIGTCSASGDDATCMITGTMTNPVELYGGSTDTSPGVTMEGTVTCDESGQVTTQAASESWGINLPLWTAPEVSGPPYWFEASCTVSVTAQIQGTGSFVAQLNYLYGTPPGADSPSPSATPSPSAAPVHLVRGFDGTCLRDTGDSTAERTKIVIWACDPTAQGQGWTYRGDELRIHGDMCVNAKGRGTSGSPAILWPCNGSPNEIWIHKPDGEYVLKVNGYKLCLTDPAYSVSNGRQAVVVACTDARDQQWSLP